MPTFSVAILTAAPKGQPSEAGGAFVKIDGREALLRSVELFLNRDNVKQIQVVVLPDALEEARRKYGPHLSFSGVKLISGGPKWLDQVSAAAGNIAAEATHVILHDAARPVVAGTDDGRGADDGHGRPRPARAGPGQRPRAQGAGEGGMLHRMAAA